MQNYMIAQNGKFLCDSHCSVPWTICFKIHTFVLVFLKGHFSFIRLLNPAPFTLNSRMLQQTSKWDANSNNFLS